MLGNNIYVRTVVGVCELFSQRCAVQSDVRATAFAVGPPLPPILFTICHCNAERNIKGKHIISNRKCVLVYENSTDVY